MRILIGVMTQESNKEYFSKAMQHISAATDIFENRIKKKNINPTIDLKIVDFGKQGGEWLKGIGFPESLIEERPGEGYCSNMNYLLDYAQGGVYDYLFSINDDAFIHPNFIFNSIGYIYQQSNLVVVGGLPQEVGGWNLPISQFSMPSEDYHEYNLTSFNRLHWKLLRVCLT
jgi:hypothetical protein